MHRLRVLLGVAVVSSNVGILAGVLLLGWSPATVFVLLLIDCLGGAFRMAIERTFAGRPPNDDQQTLLMRIWLNVLAVVAVLSRRPTKTTIERGALENIYQGLLEKRGKLVLPTKGRRKPLSPLQRVPPVTGTGLCVYPRNLLYALDLKFPAVPWLVIGVGWWSAWTTTGALLPAGSLEMTALALVPLLLGRHALVVYTWHRTGRYEHAAPTTIRRHREFVFGGVVAGLALYVVAGASDLTQIVFLLAGVLLLKLLFDLRDAGIGPWPFTPKTRVWTVIETIPDAAGSPQECFTTRKLAMYKQHVVVSLAVVCLATLSNYIPEWRTLLLGVCVVAGVVLLFDVLARWLVHANLQYRVYDGVVVVYDQLLNETQWRLDADEINGVRTDQETVIIEQRGTYDNERPVKYLAAPAAFTSAIEDHVLEQ